MAQPVHYPAFRWELAFFLVWYNKHGPNDALAEGTPNEEYHAQPANEAPRIEFRASWSPGAICAKPWAPVNGDAGEHVDLVAHHYITLAAGICSSWNSSGSLKAASSMRPTEALCARREP